MSKIDQAMQGIHHMDQAAGADKWINNVHPLSKLLVTLVYIIVLVSYEKYNIIGLMGMCLYPIIIAIIGEIPMIESIKQIRIMLLLVCIIGIANPIFDRVEIGRMGDFVITSGMVSMMTLVIKGVLAVLASYMLIVTTTIEKICYAMRMIHIPKAVVTLILLIYRYLTVLLKEVARMTQAYHLRAPKQKGIHISAWGPFVGQLLLRTIDRAETVYESMLLRGYNGEFTGSQEKAIKAGDVVYVFFFTALILLLRALPIFAIVGNLWPM